MSTRVAADCADPPTMLPAAPRVRLTAEGPLGPIVAETRQVVTLIGGRRDCHLPLPDPDISKVHCALVYTDAGLLVCDLRSRSGTTLDGQPVKVAPLRPGSKLKVGPILLKLEWLTVEGGDEAGAADPAPDTRLGAADGVPTDAAEPGLIVLEYAGRRSVLPGPVALLGNRSTCDLVVESPDVSLAHALLFRLESRAAVCDLGSRSGTYRNGERVNLAWLNPGDQLALAEEKLLVLQSGPPEPDAMHAESECCEPVAAPPDSQQRRGQRPRTRASGVEAGLAASPGASPALGSGGGPPNLVEIESSIVTLHEYIASARSELEARRDELERTQAEIDAAQRATLELQAGLGERERQLEQREATIQAEEAKLAEASAAAARQQQEVNRQSRLLQAMQRKYERQQEELSKLASDLLTREASLLARQGELEQRAAELTERSAAHESQAEELRRQAGEWAQRIPQLEQREQALRSEQEQAAARAEQLQQQQEALAGRTRELAEQAAALELRATELDQLAARRQAEFEQRAEALRQSEQVLAARESAEQETARQITRFAAALREASAALNPLSAAAPASSAAMNSAPAGSAGLGPVAIQAAEGARVPAAAERNGAGRNHSGGISERSDALPANGSGRLPAPVVDRPIFARPDAGAIPPGLPVELHERYRVLRQVSRRSDEELVAHLLAEAQRQALGRKRNGRR